MMMKRALAIAGSDCSGGAGIQADLKTFSAHGVFGMSVIVSVVAENTSRVIGWQDIDPGMVKNQIDAVYEDIGTDAVKIGMLSTPAIMEAVAERLSDLGPANVVADPVMYAKNGAPLMEKGAIGALIRNIIPLADLVTPNIPEAEELARMSLKTPGDMRGAAEKIFAMGARAVLVKGGHGEGTEESVDLLFDGREFRSFGARRIPTKNTHGTGCTLSSAIAATLALGLPLGEAVGKAKAYVTTAIEHALELGKGAGPTHHFWDLYRRGLTH
jgi:hydroxymethylpyrimidine/phosphomethylpyrimidine kinase